MTSRRLFIKDCGGDRWKGLAAGLHWVRQAGIARLEHSAPPSAPSGNDLGLRKLRTILAPDLRNVLREPASGCGTEGIGIEISFSLGCHDASCRIRQCLY